MSGALLRILALTRKELLAVRNRFAIPMVIISHDPDDIAVLGGKLVALDRGRLVE